MSIFSRARSIVAPLTFFVSLPSFGVPYEAAKPVLRETCFECHGAKKVKGGVDLQKLESEPNVAGEYELWSKVQEVVQKGEMPPDDAKVRLKEADRTSLMQWLSSSLDQAALANAGDPGPVTLRRLTKSEYEYSIRDLTGVDLQAGSELPQDGGGGEGFSNLGDVLFMNPQQVDKYFKSARTIAEHASILPGSGIQFYSQKIGLRGPAQIKSEVESSLYRWYQEMATPHLPKDDEDLHEVAYMLACWKWKHRERTGVSSLSDLAKKEGLVEAFLENWWTLLQGSEPKSRFLDLTRLPWKALPPPDQGSPNAVPVAVLESIEAIARQRKSWLLPKQWTVQRAQQDSDGIKPWPMDAQINNRRWVNVVFSDLGDGNKGDWAFLESVEFQRKGKMEPYFSWLSTYRDATRKALEAAKAAGQTLPNAAEMETELTAAEELLGMLGKHPAGRAIKPTVLIVQAPRILRLPLPQDVQRFKANGRLDLEQPDADSATIQWMATADAPPNPSAIIPGVLTIWKRGSRAQKETMGDFNVMKSVFPDTLERRLEEVSKNFHRGGKGNGVYFFNDSQLAGVLNSDQKEFQKKRLLDWSFVRNLTIPQNQQQDWDALVQSKLNEFASRAWRRPLTVEDEKNLTSIYNDGLAKSLDRESAAREVLVRVLVAPDFLFKLEEGAKPGVQPVTSWELASRLSFFLWSSLPDGPLRDKAAAGTLGQPAILKGEVQRMLRSPLATALAKEFAGQWFEFHGFDAHLKVDGKKFPEFTPELRQDLYREVVEFFSYVIRQNRPVREILQADYTFLNERLAWFYEVPDIHGPEMKKVQVAQYDRGGLLGMGAVLTKTSYPHRSSPVLRGNWLLHNVLGTPTPPPPNDVPKLDESVAEAKTLREKLERHRGDQACSVCHDKIDPLGFALESFDAIGRRRRTDDSGAKIDDSAQTKDGKEIAGLAGLRTYLRGREAEFYTLFARKLVGYALGRAVLPTDRTLILDIQKALMSEDGNFASAVNTLVQSQQFQCRRND